MRDSGRIESSGEELGTSNDPLWPAWMAQTRQLLQMGSFYVVSLYTFLPFRAQSFVTFPGPFMYTPSSRSFVSFSFLCSVRSVLVNTIHLLVYSLCVAESQDKLFIDSELHDSMGSRVRLPI